MNWRNRSDISRSDDVRRANLRSVVGTLRASGPLSRTDIVARTRLSPATVSTLMAQLTTDGVAVPVVPERSPAQHMRRGRPQVVMALNENIGCVVAVGLSYHTLTLALLDYGGEVKAFHVETIATAALSADALLSVIGDRIDHVLAGTDCAFGPLLRIAVGVQGITDVHQRSMLWGPITGAMLPIADALEKRFDVDVTVRNDCDFMALALSARAENPLGADFFVVTLSRGIGMSIVRDGRVLSGFRSSAAEFGHMIHAEGGAACRCGQHGCIEAYAGDYAIVRAALGRPTDKLPDESTDAEERHRVLQQALEKDGPARDAYLQAARAIGYGLHSVFALFDRLPVAFVGPGAAAAPIMEPVIRTIVAQSHLPRETAQTVFEWLTPERSLVVDGGALEALMHADAHLIDRNADI